MYNGNVTLYIKHLILMYFVAVSLYVGMLCLPYQHQKPARLHIWSAGVQGVIPCAFGIILNPPCGAIDVANTNISGDFFSFGLYVKLIEVEAL
jgi:hypothetical protein